MASTTQTPLQQSRWLGRNQGFVPPAQLTNESRRPLSKDSSQSFASQQQSSQNNEVRNLPPTPQEQQQHDRTHSRTHSFLSSFRKNPVANHPSGSNSRGVTDEFGNSSSPRNRTSEFLPTHNQHSPPPQQSNDPPPQFTRRHSNNGNNQQSQPPTLHPEIRSVVSLQAAQANKVYCAGNLIRRLERLPDGQRPVKDEGWAEVFAQLGGTTLSVWDMNAVNEAAKIGAQVPPSYINVTDAFIQVLGSVTVPASGDTPAKKYMNVITLNTAGANLLLFSCPDTYSLISWASALRLSGYEKARLEEIYTAHILRLSFNVEGSWKEPATRLVRGRLEGQVKIRIAGKTEWRPVWAVVSASSSGGGGSRIGVSEDGRPQSPTNQGSVTKRVSALFNRSPSDATINTQGGPYPANITFYLSQKGKDRKKALLTIRNVTQAFAVYPERPELINHSTLIKIEGLIGDEDTAGALKSREGWVYIVPEMVEGGKSGLKEMLKWTTAIHDAFGLYGRDPIHGGYTWDPRDHVSMMFAYPVGPLKEKLFLDPVLAEPLDPREDRTSAIRATLTNICLERMGPNGMPRSSSSPPQRPSEDSNLIRTDVDIEPLAGPSTRFAAASLNQRPISPPAPGHTPIQPASSSRPPSSLAPQAQNAQSSPHPQLDLLPPLDFSSPTEPQDDRRQSVTGRPLLDQSDSHPSPISEKTAVDGRSYFGDNVLRVNNLAKSEASLPPARSTGSNSGVLPRIQTGSNFASFENPVDQQQGHGQGTSQSGQNQGQDQRQILPERNFSSSPVSEHEPSLPTPRPPTDDSSKGRQSFGSFSVISGGRTGSPPVLGGSISNRSSFDVVKVGSPLRSVSPVSPPRGRMNYSFGHEEGPSTSSGSDTGKPVKSSIGGPVQPPVGSSSAVANIPRSPPPQFATQQSAVRIDPISIIKGPSPPATTPTSPNSRKIGVTLRDDQFTPLPILPTSSSKALIPPVIARDPSEPGQVQRKPVPAFVQSSVRPDSTSGEESPYEKVGEKDEYHQEPTIVSVTAISPAPRKRQGTPMFDGHAEAVVTPELEMSTISTSLYSELRKPPLGRKPSGARAPPKRLTVSDSNHSQISSNQSQISMANHLEDEADVGAAALAALSFLQQEEEDTVPPLTVTKRNTTSPLVSERPPMPTIAEPEDRAPSPPPTEPQYKSSFAPSKAAAERKARTQAAQAASQVVVLKPGRPANGGAGKGKMRRDRSAWESSDEDEEDEEEEEDEGDEGDDVPPSQLAPRLRYNQGEVPVDQPTRPPRLLPQIPASRSASDSHSARADSDLGGPPRPSYYDQEPRMRQSSSGSSGPAHPQPEYAHQVPAARQNLWSTVLDPKNGQTQSQSNTRDTFVDLNEDSHIMTKAFQPQGLLSAGLQDKQDRSAKRQEELARESGASLVNVPAKPPPPQTGLLGAITGYERERKREGGVGAALTERERDRRLAENRQRKLDDFQRMQLDQQQQMAQGGNAFSMYPNPYMSMMGNPMMMGGYPIMGGFANPQQIFAAQQAAQAYQQAMMTYSTAGSQLGGGENNMPHQGQPPPPGLGIMTPQPGFDPRMSMMNMGMMNSMAMGGWDPRMSMFPLTPGMEFNNPMVMQNPGLMPQHTGMSGPAPFGPPQPPFTSQGRSSTPVSRGSANQSPVHQQTQQLQQ